MSQLNDIKEIFSSQVYNMHGTIHLDREHVDWLIKQVEVFINFDRSELVAIKDNILHTKMHGHKLTEIEKGILTKVEAVMYPQRS
ncbi:hypothetical protein [Bacillus safensis]|uniref:hypothetical protein n=1 Tax=Bacillus safensis TaxID=561879 RepID=UPI0022ABB2B1|nr:hypothetical protein [Bacillus safensis]WAT79070.1 hypothetical protein O0R49_10885 [Bacillus safensis]